MTVFGNTRASRPVVLTPPSVKPQIGVISEPANVVGTARMGKPAIERDGLGQPGRRATADGDAAIGVQAFRFGACRLGGFPAAHASPPGRIFRRSRRRGGARRLPPVRAVSGVGQHQGRVSHRVSRPRRQGHQCARRRIRPRAGCDSKVNSSMASCHRSAARMGTGGALIQVTQRGKLRGTGRRRCHALIGLIQRPPGRFHRLRHAAPGVNVGQYQLMCFRMGAENSDIRDDRRRPLAGKTGLGPPIAAMGMPGRGHKSQLIDEKCAAIGAG